MKLSRRIAMAAAAASMVLGAAASQAEVKFGVAAEPYAPFTSKDAAGAWVGWEIDLMNDLCARMSEKCVLVEVAWDGIIPALTSKQIDVIFSSMSITNERKKTIDFSDMYYNSAAALIGPKNGDMDIAPAHLAGKTVGVQVSTIHANYTNKYFGGAAANVKTYTTQDEANADLAAGRVDYVMADLIALDAFLKTDQGACCESKGAVPHDAEILGDGVGAGLRKEDSALRDKFNMAIKAAAAEGVFEKISEKNGLAGMLVLPK